MRFRFLTPVLLTSLLFISCGDDKKEQVKKKLANAGYQSTPSDFLRASENGDLSAMKVFLKEGIDLGATDKEGYTALHLAATHKRQESAGLLIGAGMDVDTPTSKQITPLMSAAKEGHHSMVRYLLKQGAKAELRDRQNRSALILAIDGSHVDTVEELAPYSRNQLDTGLLYAAAQGKYQVVEALTNFGASVYVRHEGGMTPLMLAAQNGHTATVYTLIENGANKYAINEHGWTAAQVAAAADQELIANFLNEAPKDDEIAIHEIDVEQGVEWSETPTKKTNPSDTVTHADTPVITEKSTVQLPFIAGKTVAASTTATTNIAADFLMLDYREKPLPLIVEKTTTKNQVKHAELRMLYGIQEKVTVKEGDVIPNTRFKIVNIKRVFNDSKVTDGKPADISVVEIEDTTTGKRRQMTAQIPASASEPWAVLRSKASGETYAVRVGQRFSTSDGQPFTITDVRPNQLVLSQDDTGETTTIPLGQ